MKYTAINIGPIIPTFSMVRKPRELWVASYMFSYLMKCIIDKFSCERIISPTMLPENADKTIGLYPDRLFVKGEIKQEVLDNAVIEFASKINLSIQVAKEYFNIMCVAIDVEDNTVEDKQQIIPLLNRLLDRMELCGIRANEKAREAIWQYLTTNSHRLVDVTGRKFKNDSIETIASINIFEGDDKKDKSDKYICIVQADGDNMGKVISSLPIGEIASLSEKMLSFGQQSCKLIREFGGLPIYAGGDDLLFLAPVYSTRGTIYDLVKKIDDKYKAIQQFTIDKKLTDKDKKEITTSMSYGISMTYYKFPLYEALTAAQKLLFCTAKKVPGKNAIAWMLQKHSGSSFVATFSKEHIKLYAAFKEVIDKTEDEQLVTAVAHKLRNNTCLLSLWLDEKDLNKKEKRFDNFFKKIVDVETKTDLSRLYVDSVRKLLQEACAVADELCMEDDSEEERIKVEAMSKQDKMDKVVNYVYGMLRTAKFIKGKEENKWQNI